MTSYIYDYTYDNMSPETPLMHPSMPFLWDPLPPNSPFMMFNCSPSQSIVTSTTPLLEDDLLFCANSPLPAAVSPSVLPQTTMAASWEQQEYRDFMKDIWAKAFVDPSALFNVTLEFDGDPANLMLSNQQLCPSPSDGDKMASDTHKKQEPEVLASADLFPPLPTHDTCVMPSSPSPAQQSLPPAATAKDTCPKTTSPKAITKKPRKATKKHAKKYAKKTRLTPPDPRPYKCTICKASFARRYNLKTHEETHDKTRIRKFPCDLCPKAFDRKHDLSRHFVSVHRGLR